MCYGCKCQGEKQIKRKEGSDKEQKQSPNPDGFIGNFYQMLNKELTPILHILFQKTEEKGTLPSSFYEASIMLKPTTNKDSIKKEKTTDKYLS